MMTGRKRQQIGAFLMTRWVLLVLILLAMLVVPIWIKKSDDNKLKKSIQAEVKATKPPSSAATVPVMIPDQGARPIGFGLTFAVASPSDPLPDVAYIGCHGQPRPTDKPNKDSCNPYEGDTSCRVVLPVLCLSDGTISNPAAAGRNPLMDWTSGTLGATKPVMGAILESRLLADARCEKELGAGWRMADFHAGRSGWSWSGRPGQGLLSSGFTRYWVAINDQRGNCWDSQP